MRSQAMEVRRIRADEGLRLRALRLHALVDAPMAYGSTFAREELYPEALWRERAATGAAGGNVVTLVAERGNQLVGMATGLVVGLEPENNSHPTMVGVFVDGSVRRQGVGVELVEQVVSWARARGWTRLNVWITSRNEPAIRLYRRCRFEFTGTTRPSAHTPSLSELEMARTLDALPN
jgi:GNAT superfamily N-acetyltransferase